MSDERKHMKTHIRAAREWLGQAEKSIEHENNISGDLNLMLAQAELQRVKEIHRPSFLLRWGTSLLPLAVAGGVAAAIFWAFDSERAALPPTTVISEPLPPPAGPLVPNKAMPVPDNVPPVADEATYETANEAIGFLASEPADEASETYDVPDYHVYAPAPTGQVETNSVAANPETEPPATYMPSAAPQPPSYDMQQLMQSAGKVLRAP